ncbi:MAG: hypothetical protein ACJ73N_15335 [Bryobacteraceae bacterium]
MLAVTYFKLLDSAEASANSQPSMAQKKSAPDTYTKPELRERIKKEIVAGNKGGNPGQWSARKAQLLVQEYEKEGGGYKKPQDPAQKSLKKWGDEKWATSDGKQARRSGGIARYLPEKAWEKLSPSQKAATNKRKEEGSKEGKQFVGNTPAAARARKQATKTTAAAKKKTVTKKRSVR